MSKRYGRNQKRSARETIAALQQSTAQLNEGLLMQQGLGKHLSRKIETMQSALDDVARELGPYFYGLPPVKRQLDEYQDRFRIPAQIPASELFYRNSDQISDLVSTAAHELQFLKAGVERDKFTGSVHVQLETPSGRRFYGISAQAWGDMRRDENRLFQQIAPMIADEMSKFIARGEK